MLFKFARAESRLTVKDSFSDDRNPKAHLIRNFESLRRTHGEGSSTVLTSIERAIQTVKPNVLVRSAFKITTHSIQLKSVDGATYRAALPSRIFVVGAGKAVAEMYQSVSDIFDKRIKSAAITVPRGLRVKCEEPVKVTYAGHPIPDKSGLKGTNNIIETLSLANKNDLVVVLLSGGASALMPFPARGITLSDKQKVTALLLSSGAKISEINIVRKHLSRIKGGQLLRYVLPGTKVICLIISDVVGDQIEDIASGPTVADRSTFRDAYNILKNYKVSLGAVDRLISLGLAAKIAETPKPGDSLFSRVCNVLIGTNDVAKKSVIESLKAFGVNKFRTLEMSGEAADFGRSLAIRTREIESRETRQVAIVAGGETTVTLGVTFGSSQGGRNQEAALAYCNHLVLPSSTVAAFIGTDGRDGNSPAAGALVSRMTLKMARQKSIDLGAMLKSHQSFKALSKTNSAIRTGLTGTNVNDLAVVLINLSSSKGHK